MEDETIIDRWEIERFDPAWNEEGMLEDRNDLQEAWPVVEGALRPFGISCNLNLAERSMNVSTTPQTKDPYIIVKARYLTELLSRSVPVHQAIKILEDEMQYDIIEIGGLVKSKKQLDKRKLLLLGPNSATLKAIEIFTGCYLLIKGSTVSVMGLFNSLEKVRSIVEDCIENKVPPMHHIKTLVTKGELGRIPELENESWDRILPLYKKPNVKQKKAESQEKEPREPFPPRKMKLNSAMESGDYFFDKDASQKTLQQKLDWLDQRLQDGVPSEESLEESLAERKRMREKFINPKETTKQESSSDQGKDDMAAITTNVKKMPEELEKQSKEQKARKKVNPEPYIVSPKKGSSKKSRTS